MLESIDLALDGPGLTCIIGPNGVGKSTLVKCLTGSVKPSAGEVRILGRKVSEYRLKDLAKIVGYVPVTSSDMNRLTVVETVLVGRFAHQSRRTASKDLQATYRALRAMEIEDLAGREFSELSAGQHQKVAIARGLVQQTRILILDEPTSNLDVRHQVYVTSFLKELSHRTGMTVVMISHDLNLAAKFADVVVLMEKPGRIHSVGAPKDVIVPDAIRDVYGVDCDVVDDQGSPHVMLHDVLRRSLGKDVAISVGHGA